MNEVCDKKGGARKSVYKFSAAVSASQLKSHLLIHSPGSPHHIFLTRPLFSLIALVEEKEPQRQGASSLVMEGGTPTISPVHSRTTKNPYNP
jgi:hypothetical protein